MVGFCCSGCQVRMGRRPMAGSAGGAWKTLMMQHFLQKFICMPFPAEHRRFSISCGNKYHGRWPARLLNLINNAYWIHVTFCFLIDCVLNYHRQYCLSTPVCSHFSTTWIPYVCRLPLSHWTGLIILFDMDSFLRTSHFVGLSPSILWQVDGTITWPVLHSRSKVNITDGVFGRSSSWTLAWRHYKVEGNMSQTTINFNYLILLLLSPNLSLVFLFIDI